MGGVRRVVLGVAIMAAVMAGVAAPSGASADRRVSSAVTAKGSKKPKKVLTACKLLTVAEITQALGAAPTEPPKTDTPAECDYSSPGAFNFINISVLPLVGTPSLWVQQAQGAKASIPVAGIRDQAFRSATNATIMVRKGKQTLRIDQYVPTLTDTALENLGKAAAARL